MTKGADKPHRMDKGAGCASIVLILLIGLAGGYALARPGDRLTCERDYTGTCAEPEPPKDPCGGKK